jgi:hypothetical protein
MWFSGGMNMTGNFQRWVRITLAAATVFLTAPLFAQSEPVPDAFEGTWGIDFVVNDFGPPVVGRNTPWVAASKGDVRQMKVPAANEISARITAAWTAAGGAPPPGSLAPPRPAFPLTAAGKEAASKIDHKAVLARELACVPENLLDTTAISFYANMTIVPSKTLVAIQPELDRAARLIWLDGRKHENVIPSLGGHSIGWVKDNTLHVETSMIAGGYWNGTPISEEAVFTEEFTLSADGKSMTVYQTITDPKYLSEPLHRMLYLDRRTGADTELTISNCLDGITDQVEVGFDPAAEKHD